MALSDLSREFNDDDSLYSLEAYGLLLTPPPSATPAALTQSLTLNLLIPTSRLAPTHAVLHGLMVAPCVDHEIMAELSVCFNETFGDSANGTGPRSADTKDIYSDSERSMLKLGSPCPVSSFLLPTFFAFLSLMRTMARTVVCILAC